MKRSAALAASIVFLVLLLAAPGFAQAPASASASAFGVRVLGIVPATPEVAAAIPPGDAAEESAALIEIPADPLLVSATASTAALASSAGDIEPSLADGAAHAVGFAVTEDLDALDGNLTAEVIAAEAVATCTDGVLALETASRFQNVTLGGEVVPLEELDALFEGLEPVFEGLEPLLGETRMRIFTDRPNDVILDVPELGLRIIAWETNWDGATGTTDDSDMVWVNALRISIEDPLAQLVGPIGGEPTDIVISRAEATADCQAAAAAGPLAGPLPPPEVEPLAGPLSPPEIEPLAGPLPPAATAPQPAPALPRTGGAPLALAGFVVAGLGLGLRRLTA